ncbi:uncharacterized protein METZ01_LOCUS112880, partial [marine metagenome]
VLKYLLTVPIHEPIFFNTNGKSLGPITTIAMATMINISNQPICGI